MSEEILRALMQLFALASNTADITNESREIIEHSLSTELRKERVQRFLEMYDEYLHEFHSGKSSYEDALNPENVKSICEGINTDLTKIQKFIVLFRLLEYIYADGNISSHEAEFVRILCDSFKISKENFENAVEFARVKAGGLYPDNSQMMVVAQDENMKFEKTKYVPGANFDGVLVILQIKDMNMYVFRYVGKTNMFLNSSPVTPERTYIFNSGSALRGPKMTPVYFSDILAVFIKDAAAERLVIQANKVTYNFPSGDTGLHEFSFKERTGRLVGIMGGSGAGKSTMLNVLNGNYTPTSGTITINGFDINTEKDEIQGVIGFVSQDDLLIEELTVFENLFYSAKLSFASLNDREITEKVKSILHSLGLFKAKDLKVGNPIEKVISGGQRKRLNIALELIREPSVLFVDEPTSGLSSRDSEKIMDLMKELALKGKLIFIVIHQPSSYIFKLFDRLLLLDNGGYTIYYGEPVESVTYFKHHAHHLDADESECIECGNVNSELIFDIIDQKVVNEYGKKTERRKTPPEEWFKKYKKNEPEKARAIPERTGRPSNSLSTPNKLSQFWIFLKRDALSKAANKQYIIINLLEAPILALFIAYFVRYSAWTRHGQEPYKFFFNENIPAYIFMSVVVALFIGMTVSAEEIFKDRKLQKREKFLNLSKGSYLSSKFILLVVISAVQTLLFILVGNSILGIEDMNMRYWLVMFSTSFFANMVGLNISNSFNSAVAIYIIIPFMIIPQLIFSGVIVSFDRLNPAVSSRTVVPIIGEIMASRWSYEALMVTQFKDNPLEKELYEVDHSISHLGYLKSYWISEIEAEIQFVSHNLNNAESEARVNRISKIIQSEISQNHQDIDFPAYSFSSNLTVETLTPERIDKIKYYLEQFKKHLNKEFIIASKDRDRVIYQIEKQAGDSVTFNDLKERYFNQSVTDMVRLNNKFNKVIVVNEKLVPIIDPVFRDAKGVRSHFYAATKQLNGQKIDTYWYNIGVIWVMSLLMMITLYFDFFKKIINVLDRKRTD